MNDLELAKKKNTKLEILLCLRLAKKWIMKADFGMVIFIGKGIS